LCRSKAGRPHGGDLVELPFDDVWLELANSTFVASGIAGGWKGFAPTASRFAAKISQQFEMVAHPRNLQQLNRDLKRMSVLVVARPRFGVRQEKLMMSSG
jgi:hypothetical protein